MEAIIMRHSDERSRVYGSVKSVISAFWMLCLFSSPLIASEYYVCAHSGDDAHGGTTTEEPFATIQRGVDALGPGDTLTIAPHGVTAVLEEPEHWPS